MLIRNKLDKVQQVPCGQCKDCRLEKSSQWGVRCHHEAQLHKQNCFITLTYNNKSLPKDQNVNKTHLTNFIKKLKTYINTKQYASSKTQPYQHQPYKTFRYYAGAEYGETKTKRPHYHICLFGYDFPDKQTLRQTHFIKIKSQFRESNIYALYTSEILSKVWNKGFTTIGDLSYKSASYVARYCMKKITGDMAKTHYKRDYMELGSPTRTPEFALISRRPGIAYKWLEQYWTDVYPKDYFTIKGIKHRPPRYYDDQLFKKSPRTYYKLKYERSKKVKELIPERLKELEKHRELITKSLKRNF